MILTIFIGRLLPTDDDLIMYHVRHILIPLTLRHSLLLPRAYSPLLLRQFSVTPRPQAAVEDEDSFISKFKNTSIFQKLADKPEALSAIQAFAEVLQKSGMCCAAELVIQRY